MTRCGATLESRRPSFGSSSLIDKTGILNCLSVVPVSEQKLVDELRSRTQPHSFTDERKA
jgi:hypothetical protein